MTARNYYSLRNPGATLDIAGRTRKAEMTCAVLREQLSDNLEGCTILDMAASGGIIADFLAGRTKHAFGIDVDQHAIDFAAAHFQRPNLRFLVADATQAPFPADRFDVILCSHLYEHVRDPSQLLREIYRVLKPGGICYFAAGNRLTIMEPHHSLPFLSLLPRTAAHYYLRLTHRGRRYEETHLTMWGLRNLVKAFELIDYTGQIINDPRRYSADDMLKPHTFKTRLARLIARYAYWLLPSYIWILRKPL